MKKRVDIDWYRVFLKKVSHTWEEKLQEEMKITNQKSGIRTT